MMINKILAAAAEEESFIGFSTVEKDAEVEITIKLKKANKPLELVSFVNEPKRVAARIGSGK